MRGLLIVKALSRQRFSGAMKNIRARCISIPQRDAFHNVRIGFSKAGPFRSSQTVALRRYGKHLQPVQALLRGTSASHGQAVKL